MTTLLKRKLPLTPTLQPCVVVNIEITHLSQPKLFSVIKERVMLQRYMSLNLHLTKLNYVQPTTGLRLT